ncbi:MAG: maleylacetoacetate isomerase [Pseudomonadota bacterium]
MATTRLHGYYRSSTTYRTRIAMNLKGLPFEAIDVRLDLGAHRQADFLAENPMGAVPVVEIDGMKLLQSPAILDYLEETYPEPLLLPSDVRQRQRVRELSALIACDIHPINNLRVLKHLGATYGANQEQIAQWNRHWMSIGFDGFQTLLEETPRQSGYCVGEQITLAEVYLLPQVYNARRFDLDLSAYPLIEEIEAHCLTLSAFKDAHPDRFKPVD